MDCPACLVEMRIERAYVTEEGGEALHNQDFVCVNPACGRFSKVVKTVKSLLVTEE